MLTRMGEACTSRKLKPGLGTRTRTRILRTTMLSNSDIFTNTFLLQFLQLTTAELAILSVNFVRS